LKGSKDENLLVDCVSNYIESITLTINNNDTMLAKIDNFPRVELLNPQLINELSVVRLDFLNLPILTKYPDDSTYHVMIKFNQNPPMKYHLYYEIALVGDSQYSELLRSEEFTMVYQVKPPIGPMRAIRLRCRAGRLSLLT
jgi:hypothetical protein